MHADTHTHRAKERGASERGDDTIAENMVRGRGGGGGGRGSTEGISQSGYGE